MTIALVHFNHYVVDNKVTWPSIRSSAWKPNYGDMLVCAALLRHVRLGDTVRVSFGGSVARPIERALVRGSTYLNQEFDFSAANHTLDTLNAPTTIVGLGAQSPETDVTFLDGNQDARNFIARLNEKSVSISVRGQFTADVVARLGGKNIRVTGCPSLFYTLQCPQISISRQLSTPDRRLGISLHTGLQKSVYCASPIESRKAHVDTIRFGIDHCAALYLFEQGVKSEFQVADTELPIEQRLAAARSILVRIDLEGRLSSQELLDHMVSVTSIEEWLARASELDAIVGFRFHGNMIALLQGKPCYYYVYDSRIREFCDLYTLPYQDVRDPWVSPAEAMLNHDWEKTNVALRHCHAEMRAFFNENGFHLHTAITAPIRCH